MLTCIDYQYYIYTVSKNVKFPEFKKNTFLHRLAVCHGEWCSLLHAVPCNTCDWLCVLNF